MKKTNNIKTNIYEVLELPIEITMDLPKITLIGNQEAIIYNHKGIIEYSSTLIRINSRTGIIKVMGSDLEIRNILSEEISIVGIVDNIEILS
ncbi:sporulation protein YqfC [Tissierella creatinini]|nr:sporulation protein YqfC [Tissierella creatinini]TJX67169.1 sporulation protein YqfC [Soehngenia saccharolytica]